jgi:hypothetical protein
MWPFRGAKTTISVGIFCLYTIFVIITYIWSFASCLSSSLLECGSFPGPVSTVLIYSTSVCSDQTLVVSAL